MNKEAKSCYVCSKYDLTLKELNFGRQICESCIDAQCNKELEGYEQAMDSKLVDEWLVKLNRDHSLSQGLKIKNQLESQSDEVKIGLKLFEIKNELVDFNSDLNSYEKNIKRKVDNIKFQISQQYELSLSSINSIKFYYLNLIDYYEAELMDKLKSVSPALIEFYMKSFRLNQKFHDKSYIKNELRRELDFIGLNGHPDESLKKLKSLEIKVDNYELMLNSYINTFYLSIHSNKFLSLNGGLMKLLVNRMKKDLNIGFLSYEKIADEEQDQIRVSNQEKMKMLTFMNKKAIDCEYKIKSIHSINDNYMIYYESSSQKPNYRMQMYSSHGKLIKSVFIRDKEVYCINTNSSSLVVCYKCLKEDDNEISLAVFDSELKLTSSKTIGYLVNDKPDESKVPVKMFVDKKKVYLLLFNLTLRQPVVFVFNLSMDLMNSFYLDKIESISKKPYPVSELSNYGVFSVNNKVYIKQKSLFGNKIHVIDSVYGNYVDRFVVNHFFDSFVVDSASNYLVFLVNGKFCNYDLLNKKLINTCYFNSSDKFVDSFCLNQNGSFVSLMIK